MNQGSFFWWAWQAGSAQAPVLAGFAIIQAEKANPASAFQNFHLGI
jgi:hypothetical protein